jgi:ankyrin repeat protein
LPESGKWQQTELNFMRSSIENTGKIDSEHADALKRRGLSYVEKKEYELAIQDFNLAIQIDQNDVDAYNKLGDIYRKTNKYFFAMNAYANALKIDSNNTYAEKFLRETFFHLLANKDQDKDTQSDSISIQTEDMNSALIIEAAACGNLDEVKKLVSANTNKDIVFKGITPLMAAVLKGHVAIVEELLQHHFDVNHKCDGLTPLVAAVLKNNEELVSLLLKYGASINDVTKEGTALIVAVENNCLSIVKILIEAGCDVNLCHIEGVSPLFKACRSGYQEITQALLDAKATVDMPNMLADELTPLGAAARNGHVEIIEMLVKAGANVNYASSVGHTPLQYAHVHKRENAANKLVELGAKEDVSQQWLGEQFLQYKNWIDFKEYDRNTLNRCCENLEMCSGWTLRWLIKKNDKLQQAVARWDRRQETLTSELKEYFEEFAQVRWLQQARLFLLPKLSQNMLDSILNFISEINQQYDIAFSFGFVMTRDELVMVLNNIIYDNPKIYLSNLNHAIGLKKIGNDYVLYDSNSGTGEIVCKTIEELALKIELLFHHGDVSPYTGIFIQIIQSNEDKQNIDYQGIKEKLVNQIVNKRIKDNQLDLIDRGHTALSLATAANDVQTATALIEAGANVNINKQPPLFIAARNNCYELIEKLINAGANIDSVSEDESHESPLLNACLYGHKDVVSLLIKHKAKITINSGEHTALLNAAAAGHVDILKMLIEHANPKFNDCMMANAVWAAISYKQIESLKYLLSKGAPLEGSGSNMSMLNLAIREGDILTVRFLVEECHQDITKPDFSGLQALDHAIWCESEETSVHSKTICTFLNEVTRRRKSKEAEVFQSMIEKINKEIADITKNNGESSGMLAILQSTINDLTACLKTYIHSEQTEADFITKSTAAIEKNIQENLSKLTTDVSYFPLEIWRKLTQPLYSLLKTWFHQDYQPHFFANKTEINVENAAEKAYKTLKRLEKDLETNSKQITPQIEPL